MGPWHTGVGLTADQTTALLEEGGFREITVRHLTEVELWGRDILDERYVVTARPPVQRADPRDSGD